MEKSSAALTGLKSDHMSERVGSPELLPPAPASRSNLLPQRSVFSISPESSEHVKQSIEQGMGDISQPKSHSSTFESFQSFDLLPQSPRLAMKFQPQLRDTLQPQFPDIPPTPASFDYHKCLSMSEITERTAEEEEQSFTICCGDISYRVSGEECAKATRMAILLLNSLKADLALAAEQETRIDCQTRVSHILKDIKGRMKAWDE